MSALPLPTEQRPSGRSFLLDLLKAAACLLIVVHHLAFYGPMSHVVMPVMPELMEWLSNRGRLAVQLFLVCSGFLTAASLSKLQSLDVQDGLAMLWRRYLRLVMPLFVALSVVVVVSEIIRLELDHSSLSALPTWSQAWAHVALLQDMLNMEALSAGVWYVAIDVQLYATALLVFFVAQRLSVITSDLSLVVWCQGMWFLCVAGSLWWWRRDANLDIYAVYFYGAYGLGWLAHASRQHGFSFTMWLALLVLVAVAVWLDPSWHLMTALTVAAVLAWAPSSWLMSSTPSAAWQRAVQWISRISYAIFVIHFSISLAVNAFVTHFWPEQIWANGLGMMAAVALSFGAGAWVFKYVEEPRPTFQRWLAWLLIFMGSVALAMKINNLTG